MSDLIEGQCPINFPFHFLEDLGQGLRREL